METKVKNKVTLKNAIKWTKKWQKDHKGQPKAYLIPLVDLQEVMAEKNVVNVRAYLAYDVDAEELNSNDAAKEKYKSKLLIVGVDKDGNDMLPDANVGVDEVVPNNIYDFTKPCPPNCSHTGSLV